MTLCMIDWQAAGSFFQGVATLGAGAAAVYGAVLVGKRQLALAARQNEILDRQTKAAEMALRQALFDRRLKVFSVVSSSLSNIVHLHKMPDSDPIAETFQGAVEEAQFLFRRDVWLALSEILSVALDFIRNESFLGFEYPDGDLPDHLATAQKGRFESIRAFHASLVQKFGNEMRLGESA